jgi:site-specific recombinase XerD
MERQTLPELLNELEQEMLRLGYSSGSMAFYRRRWQMLQDFAQEQGEVNFSEKLGLDFIETHFHILENEPSRRLTQSQVQELRIIRAIGDFQLHRAILRRYCKHKEILTDPYFLETIGQFRQFCGDRGYSRVTTDHYTKQSARFLDYLAAQGISSCQIIQLPIVNAYIKTLAGYTYKTVEQNICSLRCFFRYLYETSEIQSDLAPKLPMVQARKQTRIPSVWSVDELKKLITAIDRGSPKGKRDYAIILLACILGLRVTDIKALTMDNFHWAEKKLIFVQSKTRREISLPLMPEVGWAVIDYLKYGRPQVDSAYVFVRHLAPYGPFTEADHLAQLIAAYMVKAHLPKLKKKRGMHSLRHTLASVLLENDTPLAVISDILGHVDTDSTTVYLKVDLNKLRECSLDFVEVFENA